MSAVRARRKRKFEISGMTLNSSNTRVPPKEWFQPSTTTDDDDRTELIERVESYAWHIERGLTPLVNLYELLGEVADRLHMDAHFAPEHEAACEKLARCEVVSDLKPVIHAALIEHKYKDAEPYHLAEEISGDVISYINEGIEPTEPPR